MVSISDIQNILSAPINKLHGQLITSPDLLPSDIDSLTYPLVLLSFDQALLTDTTLTYYLGLSVYLPDALNHNSSFSNHLSATSLLVLLRNELLEHNIPFDGSVLITPILLSSPRVSGATATFVIRTMLSTCPLPEI